MSPVRGAFPACHRNAGQPARIGGNRGRAAHGLPRWMARPCPQLTAQCEARAPISRPLDKRVIPVIRHGSGSGSGVAPAKSRRVPFTRDTHLTPHLTSTNKDSPPDRFARTGTHRTQHENGQRTMTQTPQRMTPVTDRARLAMDYAALQERVGDARAAVDDVYRAITLVGPHIESHAMAANGRTLITEAYRDLLRVDAALAAAAVFVEGMGA